MSHDYRAGHYTDSTNLFCSQRIKENTKNTLRHMQIAVFEFTPFGNPSNFCLSVNAAQKCLNSKELHVNYGPFQSNTGWDIKLQVTADIPRVRYWIYIYGKFIYYMFYITSNNFKYNIGGKLHCFIGLDFFNLSLQSNSFIKYSCHKLVLLINVYYFYY